MASSMYVGQLGLNNLLSPYRVRAGSDELRPGSALGMFPAATAIKALGFDPARHDRADWMFGFTGISEQGEQVWLRAEVMDWIKRMYG